MSEYTLGHGKSYAGYPPDTNPMPREILHTFPIQQTPIVHKIEGMDKLLQLLERLIILQEQAK